ncbi:hypothetical protein [Bacillus sp. OAE603]|uniref:hypothetical protein n=1 Tax=Gottfriedia sp. OAE603 TaxID=2663872 RepID=UPI001789A458
MIQYLRQLFSKEPSDKPSLPIRDTRTLSKKEIEYVVNELLTKQSNYMNEIKSGNLLADEADVQFQQLITNRLTTNLTYRIPSLDIELAYLNAILKGKKNIQVQYHLFHQLKENDTAELTNMIMNQGYSFVPTVGYLKIG